jgi:hypothetical protein
MIMNSQEGEILKEGLDSEPGVIAPFAKLWGTEELLVSFDTVNITLPPSIVGEYDSKPWPHTDQAPERHGMNCVQGIINLSQAGPNDGGLVVVKGSAPLFDRFFEENPVTGPTPWRSAKHQDFHPYSEENLDWYRAQGCELVKVCAEAGDLIMWGSREVHVSCPYLPSRSVLHNWRKDSNAPSLPKTRFIMTCWQY